jgi:hypothetical protein
MYLLHRETQEEVPVEILQISPAQVKKIMKTKQFEFNWLKEVHHQIYALRILESKEIVGLMALWDVPKEARFEIVLLELSKNNIGRNKILDRIAGCLIAFACRQAYKGYAGFVSLIPKTHLIEHYKKNYGFISFGKQLAVFKEKSEFLIQKYLSDDN